MYVNVYVKKIVSNQRSFQHLRNQYKQTNRQTNKTPPYLKYKNYKGVIKLLRDLTGKWWLIIIKLRFIFAVFLAIQPESALMFFLH